MTEKGYSFDINDFVPVVSRATKRNRMPKKYTADIVITLNSNGKKSNKHSARISFHNAIEKIAEVYDKVEIHASKNKPDRLAFIFTNDGEEPTNDSIQYKIQKRGKEGTNFKFTLTDDAEKRFKKSFINREFSTRVDPSSGHYKAIVYAWINEQKEEPK